jgi:hypothetical protein
MAKTIFRTNLQRTLSFRAKLKKTGHIRKGFLKVEGLGCKTEETRGFICKSARLRWGVDLSPGSRSDGWDLKRWLGWLTGTEVVDSGDQNDPGRGSRIRRPRSQAGGQWRGSGRRQSKCGGAGRRSGERVQSSAREHDF